jgi:hypothetical protein
MARVIIWRCQTRSADALHWLQTPVVSLTIGVTCSPIQVLGRLAYSAESEKEKSNSKVSEQQSRQSADVTKLRGIFVTAVEVFAARERCCVVRIVKQGLVVRRHSLPAGSAKAP